MDQPGLYGKIPGQADFFRVGAGDFSRAGLDGWFQQSLEGLHAEGRRLPDEPTFFLLCEAQTGAAFLGAFVPSEDAVGRTFPLAVFRALDASGLSATFPCVPETHAIFLEAAADLLQEAP